MIYGYARCSTNTEKQDVQYQLRELEKKGVPTENIRYEYESGRNDNRQALNALLETMVEGDTLVVTDITRLSRSLKHLCCIINLVVEKKLRLLIDSFDIDARSGVLNHMIEAMVLVSGVFGQMEVKMKANQIKLGLENSRKNGKVLGRPLTNYDNIPDVFMKYYPMYVSKAINKKEFARLTNFSYPTIYKYIKIVETKEL